MLRAKRPLDPKAVAAANAAVRDMTDPPGRPLDPSSAQDAPLRAQWMSAYAKAGGVVEEVGASPAIGIPVAPCDNYVELRYLHCNLAPVKGAKYHIRASGFSADGTLDQDGFVRIDGVPPLGGFNYWFDADPEAYVPRGPAVETASAPVQAQATSAFDAVLDWVWGTVQGDFNKDQSLSQIGVNTVLGLIPVVDQVLDVRDLIAGIKDLVEFYAESEAEQGAHEDVLGLSYEAWLWLAVFLIALGAIPEVGSVIKGVVKGLIRFLQDAMKRAGDLSPAQLRKAWEELVRILNYLGVKPGNAHAWLKSLPGKLDGWMDEAAKTVKAGLDSFAVLLDRAEAIARRLGAERGATALARIRELKAALRTAYNRLDVMKRRINDWLKQQFERVLGGKHTFESDGSINTKADKTGSNVRTQEEAPPPDPTLPPKPGARMQTLKVSGEPDADRVKALSFNHEQGKHDLAEGLGGARYEKATGRTLQKPAIEGADFVDPQTGPVSLKGPLVNKATGKPIAINDKNVEGLASSVVKDVQYNTFTKSVVVDTAGMNSAQRELLQTRIAEGLARNPGTSAKDILFLE